jgi:hypothetical protein
MKGGRHMAKTVSALALALLLCQGLLLVNAEAQQRPPIDVKYQDVGNIRLQVTNMGGFTRWGLPVPYTNMVCEYPQGSYVEHVNGAGIRVGALVNGVPRVSWGYAEYAGFSKCFPSFDEADTIWIASSYLPLPEGLTDMYPGYEAKSELDFICQFCDSVVAIAEHYPLYVKFIQRTYTWSYEPLNNLIYMDFDIIFLPVDPSSDVYDVDDVYVAFFFDGDVGRFATEDEFNFFWDDYSWYDEGRRLAVTNDAPGGDDGTWDSPAGLKLLKAPGDFAELRYTFRTGNRDEVDDPTDAGKYEKMSAGTIAPSMDPSEATQTAFLFGFGPFQVERPDTLPLTFALVCGNNDEEVIANADIAQWLYDRDWAAPSPPPPPPLKAYPRNRSVTLDWQHEEGEVNPEAYEDTLRMDGILQDFEGYRIYKSTGDRTGPWALLAEYDKVDWYGFNRGLEYEYVDTGLVNGSRYWYAATSFDLPDTVVLFPSLEGGITRNVVEVVPGTAPTDGLERVWVVPNPYRLDQKYASEEEETRPPGADWEWPRREGRPHLEQDRKIQFVNLPAECTIRIYTLAGDLVDTIHHDDPDRGYHDWYLLSRINQAVATELYYFVVEDGNGETQVGKFVIIK